MAHISFAIKLNKSLSVTENIATRARVQGWWQSQVCHASSLEVSKHDKCLLSVYT